MPSPESVVHRFVYSGGYADHVVAVECAFVIPNGPGDAREFVGERDGWLCCDALHVRA